MAINGDTEPSGEDDLALILFVIASSAWLAFVGAVDDSFFYLLFWLGFPFLLLALLGMAVVFFNRQVTAYRSSGNGFRAAICVGFAATYFLVAMIWLPDLTV